MFSFYPTTTTITMKENHLAILEYQIKQRFGPPAAGAAAPSSRLWWILMNYGWYFELWKNFWSMGDFFYLLRHLTFVVNPDELWLIFLIMGEHLNERWTFELWVNFQIMDELFFLLVNFLFNGELLIYSLAFDLRVVMGKLLNYGWTFELWLNFWINRELLNYGWTLEFWVIFFFYWWTLIYWWTFMSALLNYGCTFDLWVNFWIMRVNVLIMDVHFNYGWTF